MTLSSVWQNYQRAYEFLSVQIASVFLYLYVSITLNSDSSGQNSRQIWLMIAQTSIHLV